MSYDTINSLEFRSRFESNRILREKKSSRYGFVSLPQQQEKATPLTFQVFNPYYFTFSLRSVVALLVWAVLLNENLNRRIARALPNFRASKSPNTAKQRRFGAKIGLDLAVVCSFCRTTTNCGHGQIFRTTTTYGGHRLYQPLQVVVRMEPCPHK